MAKKADKQCDRCGTLDSLESHHIKHKAHGGSDAPFNRRWLCTACHDYQHAIDATRRMIQIEESRLKVLYRRLAIIERANTVDLIETRGYKSYWDLYKKKIPTFAEMWKCAPRIPRE